MTVHFGTAATGGFSYTILGGESEPTAGVYFPHGRVGYFFNPRVSDSPDRYSDIGQGDFAAAVLRDTGVQLAAGVRLLSGG